MLEVTSCVLVGGVGEAVDLTVDYKHRPLSRQKQEHSSKFIVYLDLSSLQTFSKFLYRTTTEDSLSVLKWHLRSELQHTTHRCSSYGIAASVPPHSAAASGHLHTSHTTELKQHIN